MLWSCIAECMPYKLVRQQQPAPFSTHQIRVAGPAPHQQTSCNPCYRRFYTNNCLSRPPDTAGLPSSFVWEGSHNFRARGALSEPGRP
eukprot:scaffold215039_cov15-Tisochrysis_lutea.AAC.1